MKKLTSLLLSIAIALSTTAFAWVDDSHSRAMSIATPYVKEGYLVREEFWSGSLPSRQPSIVRHQLFKGNTYWFWLGSEEDKANITLHVYDGDGKLCDTEAWQKGPRAAVKVTPKRTGTYSFVLSIEDSPTKKTRWSLAYGYK
jgi:hypothetical protein